MAGFLRFRAASAALCLCLGLASSARADTPAEDEFAVGEAYADADFSAAASDAERLRTALAFLAGGESGLAERFAARLRANTALTAYRWAKLRRAREPSLPALRQFLEAHPGWAGEGWLRGEIEAELFAGHVRPEAVRAAFAETPPQTPIGVYALALAMRAQGDAAGAAAKIRALWRESADDSWLEAALVRNEAG